MSDLTEHLEAHQARNAELKKVLLDNGVDLEEARQIECHFWASDQDHAARLGKQLYDGGFLVAAMAPTDDDEGDGWSVEGRVHVPPAEALSDSFTKRLVEMAATLDCDYDGWGTHL
jgi:regulator of RNase E activity RraB